MSEDAHIERKTKKKL